MRMNNLNLKLVFAFMVFGITFTSCDDSNEADVAAVVEKITEDDAIALVEADDISDEVDNMVDDYIFEDYNASSRTDVSSKTFGGGNGNGFGGLPDCVTRTVEEEGDTKTVTLDFGDGCELPNEHILTGKIILVYIKDEDTQTVNVTKTFDGFTFNDVAVEGENTFVRTKANANGVPESTKIMDVTYTWPDGEFISRVGTKTREWIEGSETKTWGDNVYLITGNWKSTFKDGTVRSVTITTELMRKMACRFIVSGVMEIEKGDRVGTLDFGDGTCDNVAIFTDVDGVETEIALKKRFQNKKD
ncbi:hypothetical protein SAMN05444411_105117 [Lutibacter oricola]|uniref:Lipoprotein n=1 Tax=Lutibacter oricola TaxID=762486 RepID=A0A1H3BHE6_9FLAO|nr:hypothetical protein [Lutibacter oricola]SDX41138.1 hypothetical protein SAMN05444411_105117 [Lutibacter oricola]